MAADPHAEEGVEAAEHGAHESPNLFSVEPGLMIWTVITFLVVLTILRLTAWGPILSSLAERQRNIEGAIERARQTKNEADALLAKYETMLESARDDAHEILEEARKDGIKVQEEIRARALQEAEEFKARAHREIELATDGALEEIWSQTASISTQLAERILGRTIREADQERLVRELIEEMRTEVTRESGNGSSPREA
jgi:F-type H+-transporting ATPase subunit b